MAVQTHTDVHLEAVETARPRKRKLVGLGLPEWAACKEAYSRKSYWRTVHTPSIQWALSKERLIHWGFYDVAIAYQSVHVNC